MGQFSVRNEFVATDPERTLDESDTRNRLLGVRQ